MATTLSTVASIWRTSSNISSSSSNSNAFQFARLNHTNFTRFPRLMKKKKIRYSSVAEQQVTLIPAASHTDVGAVEEETSQPVSPSDILTMFFQAEGTMTETAIPTLVEALEETEGISNLKVQVLEGIATVKLTKQTTVQATGVASSLVEAIQGSGFKLKTLNLNFEDEEDTE